MSPLLMALLRWNPAALGPWLELVSVVVLAGLMGLPCVYADTHTSLASRNIGDAWLLGSVLSLPLCSCDVTTMARAKTCCRYVADTLQVHTTLLTSRMGSSAVPSISSREGTEKGTEE
jgi:hypothetical protein